MTQGGGPPGPGAGNPATAACIATTIWANRSAPAGGGPSGPGGPAGLISPAGPTGPGIGGGGTTPPPAPPVPPAPSPGGGIGAAISKTQCNNKSNPTLLVDNWSL